MMYRHHKPNITLTLGVKKFIESTLHNFGKVVILTDGRSVSQRLKLESLGLLKIPAFISEEWNSIKPDNKRFLAIMERYTACSKFCYVADNPAKDFITSNALDWTSICLRGDQNNIHSQDKNSIKQEHLPHYWVNNFSEINIC